MIAPRPKSSLTFEACSARARAQADRSTPTAGRPMLGQRVMTAAIVLHDDRFADNYLAA